MHMTDSLNKNQDLRITQQIQHGLNIKGLTMDIRCLLSKFGCAHLLRSSQASLTFVDPWQRRNRESAMPSIQLAGLILWAERLWTRVGEVGEGWSASPSWAATWRSEGPYYHVEFAVWC